MEKDLEAIEKLFYPERRTAGSHYAEPDYDYIHRELSKKGVTLTLLWNEYCERAYANGETPYMSTRFGDKYRRWARVTKATMRVTHKPGVDFSALRGHFLKNNIDFLLKK